MPSCALLTLFGLTVGANSADSSSEPVDLHFAWPDDLVMDVRKSFSNEQSGFAVLSRPFSARYRMELARTPQDTLIVHSLDLEIDVSDPDKLAADPLALEHLVDVAHNLEVDTRGTFIRSFDAAERAAKLERAFADLLDDRFDTPGVQRFLKRQASEDSVADLTAVYWEGLVGTWAGRTLRIGERHEASPSTAWPGSRTSIRLDRRIPCEPDEAPPRCVELVFELEIDGRELVQQLEDETARQDGRPRPEVHESRIVWRLVTDPASLLPRSHERTFTMELTLEPGLAPIRNVQRVRYDYSYPQPAQP